MNQPIFMRKQRQQYRLNLQQEVEKIERLKEDFLSTVTHEFRTPLANMTNAIALLQMTLEKGNSPAAQSSQASQYLQILQEECEQQMSLINDILQLQELAAGNHPLMLTEIRMQHWIPHIAESFEEKFSNQQLAFRMDISPEMPAIATDVTCLGRILTELLENACKYTPAGGEIAAIARQKAGSVQLQVCNSGVEIPDSERQRIFDKFYRIPNDDPWKRGGTGLGLTLAQKLAAHLGGSIWVESHSNQTCFTVEFPDRAPLAMPQASESYYRAS